MVCVVHACICVVWGLCVWYAIRYAECVWCLCLEVYMCAYVWYVYVCGVVCV